MIFANLRKVLNKLPYTLVILYVVNKYCDWYIRASKYQYIAQHQIVIELYEMIHGSPQNVYTVFGWRYKYLHT